MGLNEVIYEKMKTRGDDGGGMIVMPMEGRKLNCDVVDKETGFHTDSGSQREKVELIFFTSSYSKCFSSPSIHSKCLKFHNFGGG